MTHFHEGIAHYCINDQCNNGATSFCSLIIYQDTYFPHNIYRLEVHEGELENICVDNLFKFKLVLLSDLLI